MLSVERKRASQNLTRLSKLGMPKGAGKKGEKPPRKRKCAEPVHTFTPMKVSTSDTSSDFHSQSVNPPLLQTSSVEGSSNSVASSVVNYGWPPPYYDYYNPMSQNSYSCFGRGTWPHGSSLLLVLLDLKGLHNARMNQTHALSSLCREIFAFASHVVGVCDLIKELRVALLMTCVLLDLKSDSIGTVLLANGVFLVRKPILIIVPVWHVCSLHILPLFLIH